jgi:hypothetical protein
MDDWKDGDRECRSHMHCLHEDPSAYCYCAIQQERNRTIICMLIHNLDRNCATPAGYNVLVAVHSNSGLCWLRIQQTPRIQYRRYLVPRGLHKHQLCCSQQKGLDWMLTEPRQLADNIG